MFDRLQKPFLTVETGEAYQPIRLTYELLDKDRLVKTLEQVDCLRANPSKDTWTWYWRGECDDLHFESVDSFRKNPGNPVKLGSLHISDNKCFINLSSFKRACLAGPFFHKLIGFDLTRIHNADFINKVYAIDEKLPHGFSELFNEEELERVLQQREQEYLAVQEHVEQAHSGEEAIAVLETYAKAESHKPLPFAERYHFRVAGDEKLDEMAFLGFYIFLRGRELVAIKRWLGNSDYSIANAVDDTLEAVFGGVDIDLM